MATWNRDDSDLTIGVGIGSTTIGSNLTLSANEIDVASGDLTLDVAGGLILDTSTGSIDFKKNGNTFISIDEASSGASLIHNDESKYLKIQASGVLNLTSQNSYINLNTDNGNINLFKGPSEFGRFLESSGELVIQSGSTPTTALTFSGANATFAGNLTVGSIAAGDGSSENFLVEQSGLLLKRTAAEVRSDLGISDAEIIDWTSDQGGTNIHTNNLPDITNIATLKINNNGFFTSGSGGSGTTVLTMNYTDGSTDETIYEIKGFANKDSSLRFVEGASGKFIIGNDSSEDKFDISNGASLGADSLLTLSTSGDGVLKGDLTVKGGNITGHPTTELNLRSNRDMSFVLDDNNDSTNSKFYFYHDNSEIATLDDAGNLQIDGDLTISGGNITNAITFDNGITNAGTISAGTWSGTALVAGKVPNHDDLNGFVANEHIDWTSDSAGTIHSSNYSNTQLTDEQVQDKVGAMFSGNTETNVTAVYQDADGTIDLTAEVGASDIAGFKTEEEIQDIVGAMFTGNTETRVSATYQDGDGTIDLVVDDMTADTNTQNTTVLSFVDSSDDIILRNTTTGATVGTDDIKFVAGSNITLTHTDADNITIASADTNTNQLTTFNIGVDNDTNSTTIAHGETLTFTGGTGITTQTTQDGEVTITCSVTDTNTTYTGGTNLTLDGTTFNVDDAFVKNNTDDTMQGTLTIDKNLDNTTAGVLKGFHVDVDRTGNVASGIDNVTGALINVSATGASAGTIASTGMAIVAVGDTGGSSTVNGLTIATEGADTNNGLYIHNKDGVGNDFKNVSTADSGDFFSINTTSHGATTIATIDDDASAANLTIDVDGDVITDSASNSITFKNNGTTRLTVGNNVIANAAFGVGSTYIADANIQHDGDDVINFASEGVVSIPNLLYLTQKASAGADRGNEGQIWVKNNSTTDLFFTNDDGNDIQITSGSALAASGGGKGHSDWYYYNANLSSSDAYYAEKWNDEVGIASSVNSQISNDSDTSASHWQIIRASRIVPYDATVTKFMVNLEWSGSDGDVQVSLWKGTPPNTSIQSSTVSTTIDLLGTVSFTYPGSGSKTESKSITSFNATSLTQADYLFVTLKRTSGSDGSFYHVHSTATYDY